MSATRSMIDERIAARREEVAAERRALRRRRLLRLVVVVALLAVAAAVERSPLVALAEVRVEGTQRTTVEQVRAAAALPEGGSVLRLDLGEAAARVAGLPAVAAATVRRDGPLRVVVEVVEREPLVALRAGGRAVLVDATGTVLAAGSAPGVLDVGVGAPLPAVGSEVSGAPAAALRVVEDLTGPLRALVDRMEVAEPDGVEMILADGTRVVWGDARRGPEKARALGAVLEDLGDTRVEVIDVAAPGAPTVTP